MKHFKKLSILITALAPVLLVYYILFGGLGKINDTKDVNLIKNKLWSGDYYGDIYGVVMEINELPNQFSKGCQNVPRRWRMYEPGSKEPGFYSFEVLGLTKSGNEIRMRYKVFYKATDGGDDVSIIEIKNLM